MSKGGVRENEGIGRTTSLPDVGGRQDQPHAGRGAGGGHVDGPDARVGVRGPHDDAVQLARPAMSSVKHDTPVRKRGSSFRFRGAPM